MTSLSYLQICSMPQLPPPTDAGDLPAYLTCCPERSASNQHVHLDETADRVRYLQFELQVSHILYVGDCGRFSDSHHSEICHSIYLPEPPYLHRPAACTTASVNEH
jgi:hypothetical protein